MNKQTSILARLLCVALVLIMTFGLCACPAGEPSGTSGTTSGTSTTGGKPGGHPDDVTDVIYANGGSVKGAGASLADDAFAMTAHTADEANAVELTASQFINIFRRSGPEAGKTYKITDNTPVVISGTSRDYNANGACIIAPAGFVFENASNINFSHLTVVGPVTVKSCDAVALDRLDIQNAGGAALTVEADTVGFSIADSRFSGKVAVACAADNISITDSYLSYTEVGVSDSAARGTAVINSILTGSGSAIVSKADSVYIRRNTVTAPQDALAISLTDEAVNGLIALNVINGAQKSIYLKNLKNTSVILNSVISVVAEDNHALYICDNAFGGRLRAKFNNYFLADGNTFAEDGLDHAPLLAGNENVNGDTLTDVDARLEVGANEELLPHNDRDLFLEMIREESVRIGSLDTGMEACDYLADTEAEDGYVILAPGAYAVTHEVAINAKNNNTTLYAYGALLERTKSSTPNLGRHFAIRGATNVTFKGLTVGYERQSCGQVYVLKKLSNQRLLVVTGAGMDNEFGNTNPEYYNITGMGAQREGTFYAYCDTNFQSILKRTDGFMEMSVAGSVYEMIAVGDILTCRSEQGHVNFTVDESRGIYFRDITNYGASGSYGFVEGGNRTATTYYRVANITKNGFVISEEEYNYYRELEEEFGVSLEVSVDEEGRYRGSLPHIGSIDATHTAGCAQGSVAISCIFENMCDDATNQRHNHARVDEIIDNGDGTTTIVYKGNYPRLHWDNGTGGSGIVCRPFIEGDRVFVYTGIGQLVCDTPALSVTAEYKIPDGRGGMVTKRVNNADREARMRALGGTESCMMTFYCVTVATEAINPDAYAGLDMTRNDCEDAPKVLIDNMSMASNGFIFDNCRMQNIRSRGLLIKASEGKIANCTFRNIGMSCAAILYEIFWGESGVSENVTVERNLMDHTGYFKNQDRYAPIAIEGLGSRVDEDFLLYKNILIQNNVIRNRTTDYAVYVNSARNVTIINNDFGMHVDGENEEFFTRAIHIFGAMNVKIEGNTYSTVDLPITEKIVAEQNKNVFGKDVEYNGVSQIPDSE